MASDPSFARRPQASLVAIEGIDGSGKTTLARAVAERLAEPELIYQDTREIAGEPAFATNSMAALAGLIWPRKDTHFDHELPPEYWLHLQVTWYTLLSEFVVRPRLASGKHLVVGGWYYKFVAKLRLRGFDDEHLARVFEHVVRPGVVVLLDIDVERVWERGRPFRAAEMGLHHRYPRLGRASFVDYQAKVHESLEALGRALDWKTVRLDPRDSASTNADVVADAVASELDRRSGLDRGSVRSPRLADGPVPLSL
jgi:dTMP kinase